MLENRKKIINFVFLKLPEEASHNGIAAVLKTAGRNPVGVRIPQPPQNSLHKL